MNLIRLKDSTLQMYRVKQNKTCLFMLNYYTILSKINFPVNFIIFRLPFFELNQIFRIVWFITVIKNT